MSGEECNSFQLIDGEGVFNEDGLHNFVEAVKLSERGLSYAVVSIMGSQSSGKSTLLNHLFHTNFREMDALKGRHQITQGVWLSQAVGIEPCTLVMDLEGTDGSERGEDDTTFEKQSALFALAVSDIVLINMWCHNIGLEHAANKPLLKTVFQVMMRLFSPRKTTLLFVIRDKTKTPLEVLEPILREEIQKIWNSIPKPPEHLETPLSEFFNVEVTALPSYEEKEESFKREVSSLRELYFNSTSPDGLAVDRRAVVPASGFPVNVKGIWKTIKENKDLDLPALKVMVATIRCEEIAKETIDQLATDEHWRELKETVQSGLVPRFGIELSAILGNYFSSYDSKVLYFEESVRTSKRQKLVTESLTLVNPAYQAMLGHLCSKVFSTFQVELEEAVKNGKDFAAAVQCCTKRCMEEFDQGCTDAEIQQANWDSAKIRDKFQRDIDSHASSLRAAKLSELKNRFEMQLNEALTEPVANLLDAASADTWPEIRKLLKCVTEEAVSNFTSAIAGFEIDGITASTMNEELKKYARSVVEKKAREEAKQVLISMKERFSTVFCYDAKSMPRVWIGNEDIQNIMQNARSASLKLLSVMVALRLDDKPDKIEATLSSALINSADTSGTIMEGSTSSTLNALDEIADTVGTIMERSTSSTVGTIMERSTSSSLNALDESEATLSCALIDSAHTAGNTERSTSSSLNALDESEATLSSALIDSADTADTTTDRSSTSSLVTLASSAWEGLPASDVLITPDQCRLLWRQFKSETEYLVRQALSSQKSYRRNISLLVGLGSLLVAAVSFASVGTVPAVADIPIAIGLSSVSARRAAVVALGVLQASIGVMIKELQKEQNRL